MIGTSIGLTGNPRFDFTRLHMTPFSNPTPRQPELKRVTSRVHRNTTRFSDEFPGTFDRKRTARWRIALLVNRKAPALAVGVAYLTLALIQRKTGQKSFVRVESVKISPDVD
jgi:hypothetical protein